MRSERNVILNPSDFAFLWEECKRCFYLKVVANFRRTKLSMPSIFNAIDAQMKDHFEGKQTSDVLPSLPAGVFTPSSGWVQSVPLSVPGHNTTCTIRGKLDTVVRFIDGTFGLIDFKTSQIRSKHAALYGRQLHAYALGVERAAPGNLSFSPVTTLGLVVFEPKKFRSENHTAAALTGSIGWVGIPRNDATFFAFLGEVLSLLELPNPPSAAPSCEWCQYRDKSRRTGL